MTRIERVRAATGSAKDSVLHAAEVVAPYADTAKDRAMQYLDEARVRLAPRVAFAAEQARARYDSHLAPRIELARTHVPPALDEAADRARAAAKQAAATSRPRIEQAIAAAQPVKEELLARRAAAVAAARSGLSARDIEKLVRRRDRRARVGRVVKGMALVGAVAGGAFAAWKWWDRQANPDWLVEPPAATEVPDSPSRLTAVDGSAKARRGLDPEVQAKQDEAETADRDDRE
ncbi:DUF5324 family protein [Streptomyces sp. NPDC058045]|uniref:DUF5324 family protein n=1 Tax=Streptomyces sp. NPDC058045 TaxID=3346311 RepID=UPI0036EC1E31